MQLAVRYPDAHGSLPDAQRCRASIIVLRHCHAAPPRQRAKCHGVIRHSPRHVRVCCMRARVQQLPRRLRQHDTSAIPPGVISSALASIRHHAACCASSQWLPLPRTHALSAAWRLSSGTPRIDHAPAPCASPTRPLPAPAHHDVTSAQPFPTHTHAHQPGSLPTGEVCSHPEGGFPGFPGLIVVARCRARLRRAQFAH